MKAGQLSIINNREEDYRDEFLVMKTADKIDMMLKINYNENCSTSGLRVSIYAPYVVLNKTGMEVFLFSSYAKTALPSKTLNKSTKSNLDAEKVCVKDYFIFHSRLNHSCTRMELLNH